MADVLRQGAAFLSQQRHDHMASLVTYTRGATSVELKATAARNEYDSVDASGVQHRLEVRDFLIRAQDIASLSPPHPTTGDTITETINGIAYNYRAIGEMGMPVWRWSDTNRTVMRVHTQLFTEAEA